MVEELGARAVQELAAEADASFSEIELCNLYNMFGSFFVKSH